MDIQMSHSFVHCDSTFGELTACSLSFRFCSMAQKANLKTRSGNLFALALTALMFNLLLLQSAEAASWGHQ